MKYNDVVVSKQASEYDIVKKYTCRLIHSCIVYSCRHDSDDDDDDDSDDSDDGGDDGDDNNDCNKVLTCLSTY